MLPLPDTDFAQIYPGLWVWHAYDSALKTELFSTAIADRAGLYLVDPIPLADADLAALTQTVPIAGVVVTNVNHGRAALDYSDRFSVPVFGHPEAVSSLQPSRAGDLSAVAAYFQVIEIQGAVVGEIALYHPLNGGTLILGDALINLESYRFTFLPSKYCLDQKQMRRSLRQLLPLTVGRILFGHGTPVVSRVRERLRLLLDTEAE